MSKKPDSYIGEAFFLLALKMMMCAVFGFCTLAIPIVCGVLSIIFGIIVLALKSYCKGAAIVGIIGSSIVFLILFALIF